MRGHIVFCLCAVAVMSACAGHSDKRTFPLHGQVQSLEPERKSVVLKHDEIKGFMPAMTMPYEVQDAKVLAGLTAGDVIDATLVVVPNGAYVTDIKKVGQAPL